MSAQDWPAAGARIDTLITASASAGPAARARAEELVRLVTDLYGAGLERLLEIAHEHGALTDDVLDALAGDDLVAGLLLVHGLHPYDAVTRIEQALAALRPHLGSHGADVRLLTITEDGVARIRLPASGGCGGPPPTLRASVTEAIEAAAPEITAIEVEQPPPAPSVIPVSSLFARLGSASGPVPT